jgi:hypothetical protein
MKFFEGKVYQCSECLMQIGVTVVSFGEELTVKLTHPENAGCTYSGETAERTLRQLGIETRWVN